jgi:hypothetical protein
MYDNLPSQPVLLAVSHHLEKISAKAHGRSQLVILLHRLGEDAHQVGKVCYNSDAWKAVTYEHIVSACTHYVSNTFFRFTGATLQLLLGTRVYPKGAHRRSSCAFFSVCTAKTSGWRRR